MNNQTNNENLSQGTNGQPDEYSAYRDEEYERMRIEMEKRRAERRAREHRRVMKNRIIAIAILLVIIFVAIKLKRKPIFPQEQQKSDILSFKTALTNPMIIILFAIEIINIIMMYF